VLQDGNGHSSCAPPEQQILAAGVGFLAAASKMRDLEGWCVFHYLAVVVE